MRPPLTSIVADLSSLDAVGVDHHFGRVTVTQGAALASGLSAPLDAGSAVNRANWGRFCSWLDQKGPPAVRRSLKVVCHTIAGCLADTFKMLRPGLTPLMSVTGVACAILHDIAPDTGRNHRRIASSAESDNGILKNRPAVTDLRVTATLIAIPDCQRSLIPPNVASTIVVPRVGAIPTD